MKILFLSAWFPYPPDNGSKLRIYNLLRGLSQEHEVTLIAFAHRCAINRPPELMAVCDGVHTVARRPYRPTSLRAVLGFLSPTPRAVVDTYARSMAEHIRRELESARYNLVIASEWATVAYWRAFHGMPAIYEDLELGVLEARKAIAPTPLHRLRHELTLLKLRAYLRRLLPKFGACTVVSEVDGNLLRGMVPGYERIEVIPNCVNLVDYRDVCETPQPDTLIFTGSFRYSANHDAMVWFLSEAYPRIQARVPTARLSITGDHAGLSLPPAGNVTLTGYVDDVRPLIASSWVALAPIRLGAGTRLKILEAMALRTPVVATSKGAEGLELKHEEHLLIADTPEGFAEAVARLLEQPGLRQRLADKGYQAVREKYDWPTVMPRVLGLVEQVAHA